MSQESVEIVRRLYAEGGGISASELVAPDFELDLWGRGDFSWRDWVDPGIDYVWVGSRDRAPADLGLSE
jgi:hypothetical protein